MEIMSQCLICRHFGGGTLNEGTAICLAFPQGIPRDVYFNRVGHTKPLPELGQPDGNLTIFDPTIPKKGEPGYEPGSIGLDEEGGS